MRHILTHMKTEPDNLSRTETRKLAAIMFTDMVGFSRQMGANETRTLRILAIHNQVIEQAVAAHQGHVIKTAGDGFSIEFPSVVHAVQCAQALERAFALAQQAIVLDDSLPIAHSRLSAVYTQRQQYEQAIAEGERAIALDPNDADSYAR